MLKRSGFKLSSTIRCDVHMLFAPFFDIFAITAPIDHPPLIYDRTRRTLCKHVQRLLNLEARVSACLCPRVLERLLSSSRCSRV